MTPWTSGRLPAHRASLAVWPVPSPVLQGETVGIFIGARCREGCSLGARRVEVREAEGDVVASAELGADFSNNTSLYWAAVDLAVGDTVGVRRWVARFGGYGDRHVDAEFRFGLVVVPPPQHRLTVEVTDAGVSQRRARPHDRTWAHVRAGAYSAFTDDLGRATMMVAPGEYAVAASKPHFSGAVEVVKVERDTEVRLELRPLDELDPQYVAADKHGDCCTSR